MQSQYYFENILKNWKGLKYQSKNKRTTVFLFSKDYSNKPKGQAEFVELKYALKILLTTVDISQQTNTILII